MSSADSEKSFAIVCKCWGEVEADVVVSYLVANGIDAVTAGFPQGVYPSTVNGLGQIEIKVHEDLEHKALQLLAERKVK